MLTTHIILDAAHFHSLVCLGELTMLFHINLSLFKQNLVTCFSVKKYLGYF